MKIEVDARKMECPKPVIMTKKELDKIGSGTIVTIVDNEVAKENVSKLAGSLGLPYSVDKINDNEFYINIIKGEEETLNENPQVVPERLKDLVVAISSDTMGKGEEELGKILIKSFIYTVSESSPYPRCMVFYNRGVFLTIEDSPVLEDLKKLADKGVEIISCGTCLDYYHLKEKLGVGNISNMYTIYEKLSDSKNNITIG
jgi:selenium metabolism protein YedF